MKSENEFLVDLIYNKLKDYKNKKIYLEKKDLNKFIQTLLRNS